MGTGKQRTNKEKDPTHNIGIYPMLSGCNGLKQKETMEIIGACKKCGNAIPNCLCNQFDQQIVEIPYEMDLKQHIADKAKSFRKEVGFSQQQVADFLDLQRVSICNIESGKQGLTSDNLYKLACIYEKEISEFFPDRKSVTVEEIEVEKVIPRQVKKIKKRVLKFNP